MGRELALKSSTLSQLMSTSANERSSSSTHDEHVTQHMTTTTERQQSAVTTTPSGRIIQLDFAPELDLNFDNPISKYIGRHLFRQTRPDEGTTAANSLLDSSLSSSTSTKAATNPIPTKRSRQPLPKRRLPRRFRFSNTPNPITSSQGNPNPTLESALEITPPVFLKMAAKAPHLMHAFNPQAAMSFASEPSDPNPISNPNPLGSYPPTKVLFSEKNSTRKFEIKLWDAVPFVEGREVPSGMKKR